MSSWQQRRPRQPGLHMPANSSAASAAVACPTPELDDRTDLAASRAATSNGWLEQRSSCQGAGRPTPSYRSSAGQVVTAPPGSGQMQKLLKHGVKRRPSRACRLYSHPASIFCKLGPLVGRALAPASTAVLPPPSAGHLAEVERRHSAGNLTGEDGAVGRMPAAVGVRSASALSAAGHSAAWVRRTCCANLVTPVRHWRLCNSNTRSFCVVPCLSRSVAESPCQPARLGRPGLTFT